MKTAWAFFVLLILSTMYPARDLVSQENDPYDFRVEPKIIINDGGFDGKTVWSQVAIGDVPNGESILVAQKGFLGHGDDYLGINFALSQDKGKTWSKFEPILSLVREKDPQGWEYAPCDSSMQWHKASGKLLMAGARIWYKGEKKWRDQIDSRNNPDGLVSSNTWYVTYDPDKKNFGESQCIRVPKSSNAIQGMFGCAQRYDLPDGTILMPVYGMSKTGRYQVVVLHCQYDGKTLTWLKEGKPLQLEVQRGFAEPQLIQFRGKFYLSLRNDVKGYLATSDDGLNFSEPRPWVWKEDGKEIGSYNTQQHWLMFKDSLLLVYTRRTADNNHIFRNRAPLFAAVFCPESLSLIRASEKIVVPERGSGLGNFHVLHVSDSESWVAVGEWPHAIGKNDDKDKGNRSIWLSKVRK